MYDDQPNHHFNFWISFVVIVSLCLGLCFAVYDSLVLDDPTVSLLVRFFAVSMVVLIISLAAFALYLLWIVYRYEVRDERERHLTAYSDVPLTRDRLFYQDELRDIVEGHESMSQDELDRLYGNPFDSAEIDSYLDE